MTRRLMLLITAFTLAVAGATAGGTWALFSNTQSVGGNTLTTSTAFVRVKYGSFTKKTDGSGTQAITGVGFTPKAVIFYYTRQTATGFAAVQTMGFGFAAGGKGQGVAIAEDDNAGTSNSGRRMSEDYPVIILSNGTPTTAAYAKVSSFDADGFTLDWSANEARADIIRYVALGGDGITNAYAFSFDLATGTGNQAVTGVGFRPDLVMFLSAFTAAKDTDTADSQLSLGIAASSTQEGSIVIGSDDAVASNATKVTQQRTDASILHLTATMTQDAIVDFVSMDSDGFTVNKSDAPAATTRVHFLALKGGTHKVGSITQPSGTGNTATTGVGFKPRSLMLFSGNKVAGSGIVNPGTISIGAAHDAIARGSIWSEAKNVDPSDTNSYTSATDILTLAASASTVNARADLTSFDSDGFTLNWSAADATAREIIYWALR